MKYLKVEGAGRPEAEGRHRRVGRCRRAGQHVEVIGEAHEEGISDPICAITISDPTGDDQ